MDTVFYVSIALILLITGSMIGYFYALATSKKFADRVNAELRARERRFKQAGRQDLADLTKGLRKGENPRKLRENMPPELREEFDQFIEKTTKRKDK